MLIRCTIAFRDLKARTWRNVGDVWEADASRLAEINGTRYGGMAEEIVAELPETAPATRSEAEAGNTRKAAKQTGESPERPTLQELEGMNVRQLVERCIAEGVETKGRPRKAELIALLRTHYGLE